jgi:hypothetical protein
MEATAAPQRIVARYDLMRWQRLPFTMSAGGKINADRA